MIKTTRIPVYVSGKLKARLIERARCQNRSLTCEAVTFLIRRYRPPAHAVLEREILRRSAPRNAPAAALHDGAPEAVMLTLPDTLRARITEEARRNFRSLSAEVMRALIAEYGENEETL